MTQNSWNTSDLIEVKTNLQKYISRIILFIKTAVSINDSLDHEPQAYAGLGHGVPVEGPHHLLYLLDQILGFVARFCYDPLFRFAPTQNSGKSDNQASWEARPPPPTPPQQCSYWCFQKPLIFIMVRPAQSPETVPAPAPSCRFIFAGMRLLVFIYVSADNWDCFADKK